MQAEAISFASRYNYPSHVIYAVRDTNKLDDKGQKKGVWTRIGAAWPTKSGNGFSLQLEALPVGKSRVYMMQWPAREEGKEEELTYEEEEANF